MTSYEIVTGATYTRIDLHENGTVRTIYVHRSEYRHWDA